MFQFEQTTLAVVVDVRKHLGPPFASPEYLGNAVLTTKSTHNLSPINLLHNVSDLGVEAIAAFACKIYTEVAGIDKAWVMSRLVQLSSAQKPSPDNCDLVFVNGPDLYITS